jgi:hypothetical protein
MQCVVRDYKKAPPIYKLIRFNYHQRAWCQYNTFYSTVPVPVGNSATLETRYFKITHLEFSQQTVVLNMRRL